MRYSLEARVPFLDHRIAELSLNIDTALKLKFSQKKYLLKKILFQHIPSSMFDRPKQGFSIPLENWMRNELKERVCDSLESADLDLMGLNREYIGGLRKQFYNHNRGFMYNRLWLIYILSNWIRKNKAHIRS
jgi:asparagine synthase (glutamine-hydrolysing)